MQITCACKFKTYIVANITGRVQFTITNIYYKAGKVMHTLIRKQFGRQYITWKKKRNSSQISDLIISLHEQIRCVRRKEICLFSNQVKLNQFHNPYFSTFTAFHPIQFAAIYVPAYSCFFPVCTLLVKMVMEKVSV